MAWRQRRLDRHPDLQLLTSSLSLCIGALLLTGAWLSKAHEASPVVVQPESNTISLLVDEPNVSADIVLSYDFEIAHFYTVDPMRQQDESLLALLSFSGATVVHWHLYFVTYNQNGAPTPTLSGMRSIDTSDIFDGDSTRVYRVDGTWRAAGRPRASDIQGELESGARTDRFLTDKVNGVQIPSAANSLDLFSAASIRYRLPGPNGNAVNLTDLRDFGAGGRRATWVDGVQPASLSWKILLADTGHSVLSRSNRGPTEDGSVDGHWAWSGSGTTEGVDVVLQSGSLEQNRSDALFIRGVLLGIGGSAVVSGLIPLLTYPSHRRRREHRGETSQQ